jgi:hypothetical protein
MSFRGFRVPHQAWQPRCKKMEYTLAARVMPLGLEMTYSPKKFQLKILR